MLMDSLLFSFSFINKSFPSSINLSTISILISKVEGLLLHGPSQLMLLIGLLYLCIAESVPQVHPIQSQHLNCGIVYQLTSLAQDH